MWEEQIAELFRQLGDTRDEDAIRTEILPMIVQHDSPELLLPISEQPLKDLATLFKSADTIKLILALLSICLFRRRRSKRQRKIEKIYRKKLLDKLHHQVVSNADHFTELGSHRTTQNAQESQTASFGGL